MDKFKELDLEEKLKVLEKYLRKKVIVRFRDVLDKIFSKNKSGVTIEDITEEDEKKGSDDEEDVPITQLRRRSDKIIQPRLAIRSPVRSPSRSSPSTDIVPVYRETNAYGARPGVAPPVYRRRPDRAMPPRATPSWKVPTYSDINAKLERARNLRQELFPDGKIEYVEEKSKDEMGRNITTVREEKRSLDYADLDLINSMAEAERRKAIDMEEIRRQNEKIERVSQTIRANKYAQDLARQQSKIREVSKHEDSAMLIKELHRPQQEIAACLGLI
jgi:hypothetical protein